MSPTPRHLTGQLLGGRYMLLSPIAQGGMGEVWKARDRETAQIVAAKVLRPELTGENASLSRFRTEAHNAMRVQHPNIASVLDSGQDSGRGWIVMELVEGLPLTDFLKDGQQLPISDLLPILYQVAMALEALSNAGVVHRDIKPANILIRPDGVAKLTDFGISRSVGQETMTAAGMVMGTAQYLPPEQAMGHRATTLGDLYALGVIAYECVAGCRPFTGATQVDIAFSHVNDPVPPLSEEIPAPLTQVIMRLLEKEPKKRFESGLALAKEIAYVARQLELSVQPHPLSIVADTKAEAPVGAHAAPNSEEVDHSAPSPLTPASTPQPDVPAADEQEPTQEQRTADTASYVKDVNPTTDLHPQGQTTRDVERRALIAKLEARAAQRRQDDDAAASTPPMQSAGATAAVGARWRPISSTAASHTTIPPVQRRSIRDPQQHVEPEQHPRHRSTGVRATPAGEPSARKASHTPSIPPASRKSSISAPHHHSGASWLNQAGKTGQTTRAGQLGQTWRRTPRWHSLNTTPHLEPPRQSRTITKYNRSRIAPPLTRTERFGRAAVIVLVIVTLLLIAYAIANRFAGNLIPSFSAVPMTVHYPEEALTWLNSWTIY